MTYKMTPTPEQLAECPLCGSGDCFESSVLLQATEIAELKEYKQLYEDAMGASNAAGWVGVSAAQVIEQQDSEIAELKAKNKLLEDVYATDEREFVRLNAKLAEVLPLAKFGATVLRTYSHNGDITEGQVHNAAKQTNCMHDAKAFTVFPPNIEATIEQLLKD